MKLNCTHTRTHARDSKTHVRYFIHRTIENRFSSSTLFYFLQKKPYNSITEFFADEKSSDLHNNVPFYPIFIAQRQAIANFCQPSNLNYLITKTITHDDKTTSSWNQLLRKSHFDSAIYWTSTYFYASKQLHNQPNDKDNSTI
jgi:hypothetical protein